MINKQYDQMLEDMRNAFLNTTVPIQRSDISKLSEVEKSKKIIELETEVSNLKMELLIREEVDKQYIGEIIKSKFVSISELLENPIIKLPSGSQVEFKNLNDDALEYLESLVSKQKNYDNKLKVK